MKKQEIIEKVKGAALVETYRFTSNDHSLHTDNLKYIGTHTFDNEEIDNLPFKDGEVDVDIHIMGKEEYEATVLVNSSESWPEDLEEDDKIAVIIVNEEEGLDYQSEPSLDDIADENGLSIEETTSERNGYPSHLKKVLVGFDSFEQAEQIAKENGLALIWIDRRDGWQLWHRGETAYEPMSIEESDYGEDYSFEDDSERFMEMARERISEMCEEGASFDDIRSYMDKVEKVNDAIEDLEDDQTVVTYCGEYYDTIKLHPIYFSYDTKTTQLAAIKE